ncbi:hypothetical protein [Celeribacter baekdonensis]|uniref:hypothetical protein n=1 Tax=Celeribacter baekdonensis TaxID=875171 RepID=UPI0030D96AAD
MRLTNLSESIEDRVDRAILGSVSGGARHGRATACRLIWSDFMALNPRALLGSTP